LELELVGQGRPVDVVGEVVDQRAVDLVLVGARLLAARRAYAGHGGAHARARAAEVEAVLVDLVEEVLGGLGRCADEHDVAGLAVEGDQSRTPLLPAVAEPAQDVGGVVVAGRGLHSQRVKLARFRKLLADLGKARDDAAAVTVHADRAALPVALAGLVGMLELAEQGVGDALDAGVFVLVPKPLDAGHEAGPRTVFQFIEHRGGVLVFRHGLARSSSNRVRSDQKKPPAAGDGAGRLALDIRPFVTAGAGRDRWSASAMISTLLRRGVAGLFRIIPLGVIFLPGPANRLRASPVKGP